MTCVLLPASIPTGLKPLLKRDVCLYFYIHICILEELEMEAWWKFTFRKKWMLIFCCRRSSCKILCKNTVCFLKGVNSFVDNSHCMAEFYFPFLFHHSSDPRIELVAYFPLQRHFSAIPPPVGDVLEDVHQL